MQARSRADLGLWENPNEDSGGREVSSGLCIEVAWWHVLFSILMDGSLKALQISSAYIC